MQKDSLPSWIVAAVTTAILAPAPAAPASEDRYTVRPQVAGPHDDILVPVSVPDCKRAFRQDPPTASMQVLPGDGSWLRSVVRLVLELELRPVADDESCIFWEPYKEPVLAVRVGRLPPGVHRIEMEVHRYPTGSDTPSVGTSTHLVGVLEHPRFESGFWYEAARPGHGVSLIVRSGQTRETDDEGTAFVDLRLPQSLYLSWQTFDQAGAPLWLVGGVADASVEPLSIDLARFEGMRYPALDPPDLTSQHWGSVTLQPRGCGQLHAVWRPAAASLPPRVMQLVRLVGTEELSYCEPHPSWYTILPVVPTDDRLD